MVGYIKLHRIIVTKDIYLKPPLYLRVFERLIIEASHRCKRIDYGKGTKLIKRGERLTSIRQIAEWVGWYERGIFKVPNPKTISEILNWLIEKEMIEIYNKGNSQETHYKIVNYEKYQAKDDNESNSQVTVNGAVRKQQTDTNKNDKEDSIYIFNKQNSCQDIEKAVDNLKKDFGNNYKIELAGLKTKKLAEYESQGTSTITALVKFDKWFKGTYGCTYDEALTL